MSYGGYGAYGGGRMPPAGGPPSYGGGYGGGGYGGGGGGFGGGGARRDLDTMVLHEERFDNLPRGCRTWSGRAPHAEVES
jgi:hypothetical protein